MDQQPIKSQSTLRLVWQYEYGRFVVRR